MLFLLFKFLVTITITTFQIIMITIIVKFFPIKEKKEDPQLPF